MNGTPHLIALPQIGTASIEHGGTFAGIHSTPQGDFALFVSDRASQRDAVKWQDACKAFDGQTIAGHADWYLPSLAELQIARANVAGLFEKNWYWSSTQYSRHDAWVVDFELGYSVTSDKDDEFRVRAFRRVPLEHFKASTLANAPAQAAEGGPAVDSAIECLAKLANLFAHYNPRHPMGDGMYAAWTAEFRKASELVRAASTNGGAA